MFDYPTKNFTDWVRLSSFDFWFGFVRSTTPGLRRVGPKLVFPIFFRDKKYISRKKSHHVQSRRYLWTKRLRILILHHVPLLARYWGGHISSYKHCTTFTDFQTQNWLFFSFFDSRPRDFFLKDSYNFVSSPSWLERWFMFLLCFVFYRLPVSTFEWKQPNFLVV